MSILNESLGITNYFHGQYILYESYINKFLKLQTHVGSDVRREVFRGAELCERVIATLLIIERLTLYKLTASLESEEHKVIYETRYTHNKAVLDRYMHTLTPFVQRYITRD